MIRHPYFHDEIQTNDTLKNIDSAMNQNRFIYAMEDLKNWKSDN